MACTLQRLSVWLRKQRSSQRFLGVAKKAPVFTEGPVLAPVHLIFLYWRCGFFGLSCQKKKDIHQQSITTIAPSTSRVKIMFVLVISPVSVGHIPWNSLKSILPPKWLGFISSLDNYNYIYIHTYTKTSEKPCLGGRFAAGFCSSWYTLP